MRSFNDTSGREWRVSVTVASVKRVKELVEVDLLKCMSNENTLRDLASDDILMVDVVAAILKPQLDEAGITDVQFCECMAGDSMAKAWEALIAELSDFSRNPNTRRVMGKVFEKVLEIENKLVTIAEERLESGEVDKIVEDEIAKATPPTRPTGGESSTSSPDEPESIPDRSRSES